MPKTPDEIAAVIQKHAEYEGGTTRPVRGALSVWTAGNAILVSAEEDADYVAQFFHTHDITRAEALANAHRFAASERMLAALVALVEEWWEPEDGDPFWDEARAAIKAARGE